MFHLAPAVAVVQLRSERRDQGEVNAGGAGYPEHRMGVCCHLCGLLGRNRVVNLLEHCGALITLDSGAEARLCAVDTFRTGRNRRWGCSLKHAYLHVCTYRILDGLQMYLGGNRLRETGHFRGRSAVRLELPLPVGLLRPLRRTVTALSRRQDRQSAESQDNARDDHS